MSKITNEGLTRSSPHRMLYSCTHMATVGVKGLTFYREQVIGIRDESSQTGESRLISQLIAVCRCTWIGCTCSGSGWTRHTWTSSRQRALGRRRGLLEVGDAKQRGEKAHGQIVRRHLHTMTGLL